MGENGKIQLLTWMIGNQMYGADVKFCLEVQKDISVVEVPHSKKYISGIVNLRGDVVTVLDLQVLLAQKAAATRERSVIIRFNSRERQVAIKADAIRDVLEIPFSKLEDAGTRLSSTETKYLPYIAYTDSTFLLILNIEELFVVK